MEREREEKKREREGKEGKAKDHGYGTTKKGPGQESIGVLWHYVATEGRYPAFIVMMKTGPDTRHKNEAKKGPTYILKQNKMRNELH